MNTCRLRLRLCELESGFSAFKKIIVLYLTIVICFFMSLQQARMEEEEKQRSRVDCALASTSSDSKKPRIKKSAYFSDEEELSD